MAQGKYIKCYKQERFYNAELLFEETFYLIHPLSYETLYYLLIKAKLFHSFIIKIVLDTAFPNTMLKMV
jgi:hypothetical protein